jgi:hypothetical protein
MKPDGPGVEPAHPDGGGVDTLKAFDIKSICMSISKENGF